MALNAPIDGGGDNDRTRPMIALSASAALIGIALSVAGSEGLGSVVTVGGFLVLAWSVHRFGRTGPA